MATLGQKVSSILIELADCLCREIKKQEMPEPCFCGVLPGDAAPFVYCNACEGGQAWVRLIGVGEPDGVLPLNNCVGLMAVRFEVGMVFGWLPVDDDGEPVDMSAALAATERQVNEMSLMHKVLTCCPLSIEERVGALAYEPVGPDGTCLGGIWTGSVAVL